ncbi:isoleucine--tRNA ligase [Oharaeibacter diazotrophicus]|uniref:Isoleucine--tRNA ligase n=1 Tax=Oharaeibacter diazotrophicus TaxID=1920512 RepID=A0A4R6RCN3_9HYPH|nr:isoleucine--tRNA ligase [Oharaeibacter diazotrophicus]TDP83457.1 isoleucyl-tRNA synthetase [Oharaeibacter diazotrophicus]BBE72290.1 isoleucine-tRNA ligase [Pleomorphomonas sp. SM30]GLS79060.1 isoleucine--tRNA ligase [Oharaeibacter diazotrophicus]
MTDRQPETARDYSETLNLPVTEFPMRAGLPQKEPALIARWDGMNLYARLRESAAGRPKFVLHDGPPYANGNLHIGHALNKTLKDIVTRSHQMLGYDSNYVPGWDCHGLPIEWKVEERYRADGKNKDEVPINDFRAECRAYAEHWVGVQAAEFRRLGVEGDFARPYTTMAFSAEAIIARELLKFAVSGQLYRGSKPVMWSVVEKTALAEAEIEYEEYQSDTIFVKFPVTTGDGALAGAAVVIWTTTPWTMPGNRAISYSNKIGYGLYEVTDAPENNWAKIGERYVLADALAEGVFKAAKVGAFARLADVSPDLLAGLVCAHPLKGLGGGYGFAVPLLDGDHVTDETGTGFVHTAPGHGTDDFEIWTANARALAERGIDTAIPFTVDDDGFLTREAPGFEGRRVITDKGDKGDANQAVIEALAAAGAMVARGRLKHQYPHSWRSKKPVIFRNTPQWFIHMDRAIDRPGDTLRTRALAAIEATEFYPPTGRNRLTGMIANRPDWVVSRQRAWGVPIAVFRHKDTGALIPGADFARNDDYVARVDAAFRAEGADAWFADGAAERFLGGLVDDVGSYEQVRDILDVWFDSGSTQAFVLEQRPDLKWPADVYLEGSDQHRGWFHSSLLESCGTRGRAPYDVLVTHGFTMAEDGRKMSKSLGNQVFPQDVIAQSGADILRLWVASTDYAEDQRIGKEILKTVTDTYRKIRNTLRWMLGTLAHDDGSSMPVAEMPELERLMLHRLAELDEVVRAGYRGFDYKRIHAQLSQFMTVELSAFYFDVRKDALYCDPAGSVRRRAALEVVRHLYRCLVTWMAPLMPFTMEEAWLDRHPGETSSVHLQLFPDIPAGWRDDELAEKWTKIRRVRRVVTGALEVERAAKRIGSSLEAAPVVHVADPELRAALDGVDLAEIAITSQIMVSDAPAPPGAFRLDDVADVAVVPALAEGRKCARSWKILPEVGTDPDYPDLTLRDAEAVRAFDAARSAA